VDEPSRGSTVGRALGVVTLHVALVVWLTWPLGANLATHVPHTREIASTDLPYCAWVLAYETHTLATRPASILDANIYHPAPRTLFYGPTYLAALPIYAPVWAATGNPTLAINFVFLAGLALTSAALHWVVWRWTASHAAGVIAGWTFLLSRWTITWFVPTVPPYGVLWYFPFIVAAVATPARTWRAALRTVPLLVLQSLTDLIFVGGAVMAPAAAIALGRLARPSTRQAGLRLLAALGLTVVVLSPLYLGYVDVRRREPNITQQSVWKSWHEFVPLPVGVLDEHVPVSVPHLVWPLVLAGVSLLALRRGHGRAPSRAWGHAALWLGLGTVLALDGTSLPGVGRFRMPHFLLFDAAGIGAALRVSTRFAVAALIGVSLLAGLAFAELTARARAGVATLLALGVMALTYAECRENWFRWIVERKPVPAVYPLEATLEPSPITQLLRTSDAVVLELPLLPRAVAGRPHATAMFRSIFHWRPLLNGYGSYYPSGFAERMELALRAPDPEALRTLQRETGLTHLIVNAGSPLARPIWMRAAAAPGSGLRLVAEDDATLLFAVEFPPQLPGAGPTAPSSPTT